VVHSFKLHGVVIPNGRRQAVDGRPRVGIEAQRVAGLGIALIEPELRRVTRAGHTAEKGQSGQEAQDQTKTIAGIAAAVAAGATL